MSYLQYFFNPSHLLTLRPPAMHARALIILAAVFGAMIVVAIISSLTVKKTKDGLRIKALRRLATAGWTMGIIGFVYLFFAAEGIVLLSARFFLIIIALITIIWLAFILRYWVVALPRVRAEIDQQREFKKYLP